MTMSISIWMVLLEVYLIGHSNNSNRIRNKQVMSFSFQLIGLPMLPRNSLQYQFSSALSPYLTLVLCAPLKLR